MLFTKSHISAQICEKRDQHKSHNNTFLVLTLTDTARQYFFGDSCARKRVRSMKQRNKSKVEGMPSRNDHPRNTQAPQKSVQRGHQGESTPHSRRPNPQSLAPQTDLLQGQDPRKTGKKEKGRRRSTLAKRRWTGEGSWVSQITACPAMIRTIKQWSAY